MKIAIITGASSGMGMEFARQLDKRLGKTDEIWLLARNKDKLETLSASMRMKTRVIAIDLTDKNAFKQFEEVLAIRNPKITALVNCAGVGFHKAFAKHSVEELESMIALNMSALTRMTRLCLPYMQKGSRLLQISSGAAFVPQTDFAVYAASKAYVYALSRALGRELKQKGITVTVVCPGPVDTPFLIKAYGDASEMSRLKRLSTGKCSSVVKQALDDCRKGKSVSLYGLPMKLLYVSTQSVQNILLRCFRA